MNFNSLESNKNTPSAKIETKPIFEEFIPKDFKENPLDYFEKYGVNIKSGEIQRNEEGIIKEDPTAVKILPTWINSKHEELKVVAKKVNSIKSQVGKSNNPFYEYEIMEIAEEFNLPAPKPIAKIEQDGTHLILMKMVAGITWTENGMKKSIHESNLTVVEKEHLLNQAQEMMSDLQRRFEEIGLIRKWKLKDMIFDVDLENKIVKSITPTDWERTEINLEKLENARKNFSI